MTSNPDGSATVQLNRTIPRPEGGEIDGNPATYEYLIEPGTTSPFTGEPGTVPQSGQTATIYTDGTTVICVLIR